MASHKIHGAMVALRTGLDLGWPSANLRFRPGIELFAGGPVSDNDVELPDLGIGFTAAVAYTW
jgi:hypothetical protein